MKKKAFSLIELMVAVSVLSIGIILVARSFLSASNALDTIENKISAIGILEIKMSDIEERLLEPDAKFEPVKEDIVVNNRKGIFAADIQNIPIGKAEDNNSINKITLNVSWKEGDRSNDETLATYVRSEKK